MRLQQRPAEVGQSSESMSVTMQGLDGVARRPRVVRAVGRVLALWCRSVCDHGVDCLCQSLTAENREAIEERHHALLGKDGQLLLNEDIARIELLAHDVNSRARSLFALGQHPEIRLDPGITRQER